MKKIYKNQSAEKKPENELYGMETRDSLQSVNFATTENPYLTEHVEEETEN